MDSCVSQSKEQFRERPENGGPAAAARPHSPGGNRLNKLNCPLMNKSYISKHAIRQYDTATHTFVYYIITVINCWHVGYHNATVQVCSQDFQTFSSAKIRCRSCTSHTCPSIPVAVVASLVIRRFRTTSRYPADNDESYAGSILFLTRRT